jgi:mono/diheme cytochrome c family protein
MAGLVPALADSAIDRGRYLVRGIAGCGDCHSPTPESGFPTADAPLSGGEPVVTRTFTAYPPNITSDPTYGIGAWTEDQIVTALREGKRPDGRILRPPMPVDFLRNLSDEDAYAIAAYLKSTSPVSTKTPVSEYKPVPLPTSYGPPVGHIKTPPSSDKVATGAYLASVAHCMECHTPLIALGHPDPNRLGAGGRVLQSNPNVSANITPDKQTGIGSWTDAQIKTAMTTGIRPDGRMLGRPMPWYFFQNVSDVDLDAIIAWLHTLKPIYNKVER